MNISWPMVVIIAIVMVGIAAVASGVIAARAEVAREEAKGKHGEQYRELAAGYESLAKEIRDAQKTMQADLAEVRKRTEAMERMMREVQ